MQSAKTNFLSCRPLPKLLRLRNIQKINTTIQAIILYPMEDGHWKILIWSNMDMAVGTDMDKDADMDTVKPELSESLEARGGPYV